ncbi:MAG: hypothetical protein EOP53_05435 [Sphingobacteriales bacterium]|nr:MAG: hypothetical protein EOP53_05435 [Sphingobacteriales bacterium]
MSAAEMKKEINEKMNSLTEVELDFVLQIINKIKPPHSDSKHNMESIFEEAVEQYGVVLEKLSK